MDSASPLKPSFFEAYASAHLSSALRPAFRFVLEVLSVRHPALIRISARADDIFTGLLLVLETSQLRTDAALLAESFYSLRRTAATSVKKHGSTPEPLSGRQILLSVAMAVLVPHFRATLDTWHSSATGGAAAELFAEGYAPGLAAAARATDEPHVAEQTARSCPSHMIRISDVFGIVLSEMKRLLRALRRVFSSPSARVLALTWYPRVSALFESTDLAFNLLYLFGHTRFFSLSLAIQRLILRRSNASEMMQSSKGNTSFFPPGESRIDLPRIVAATSERVLMVCKASFFAGIFAFRFLQYYYAAEASAPRETGPTIPPPEPLLPAAGVDRELAMAPGKCPLCHRNRVNPTACATSGYVFCYLCILSHIQEREICPVTAAPTGVQDLVRIYDEAGGT
eukprot:GFKZ01001327.1.p1 GENE.GFKZ01001327.1~~GFKZ01001327.1.p1  ORF type:complete len:398 (+),score=29.15 GFKZ01001327.1:211-1404(+)